MWIPEYVTYAEIENQKKFYQDYRFDHVWSWKIKTDYNEVSFREIEGF